MKESGQISMKVVGIGGAGSNIVDRLMLSNPAGIQLTVINTDHQALANSPVTDKRCIGESITRGLGASGDPGIGKEAALADKAELEAMVEEVDLLFIATGLGGGAGTGIAPVLADIAAQKGATVIAFVTLPFTIERAGRARVAKEGLERLRKVSNAVIPLPNDLLVQVSDGNASLLDAFSQADAWIERGISSIWKMMSQTGLMNLDYSQLRQVFSNRAGKTLFGLGEGSGSKAASDAIEDLKLCPLLHTPEFSKKADHLLVNLIGGASLGIGETQLIMESVTEAFGKDANVVMGAVIDESMGDKVEICVIGTSDISDVSIVRGRRRVLSAPKILESPTAESDSSSQKASRAVHRKRIKVQQDEFAFNEGEPRGEFEDTMGYIFEGQDLDTPTYLRRGVKVPV